MTRPHELPGGPILTGDPTAGAAAIAKRVGRDGSSITGARCGNRGAGCGDGAEGRRRAYETGNGGMSAPAGGETPATYFAASAATVLRARDGARRAPEGVSSLSTAAGACASAAFSGAAS